MYRALLNFNDRAQRSLPLVFTDTGPTIFFAMRNLPNSNLIVDDGIYGFGPAKSTAKMAA